MQQCILHRIWAKMLYGTRSFIWGLAGFLAVWVPGLTTVMVASWNPHLTRNGYAQFTMAQSKMRWTVLSSLPNSCFSSTWKQMASLPARDKPWLLYPLHTAMWYDFCFYLFWLFPDSPSALAQILREARDSMTSMQTALDRYASLLDTNRPEVHVLQVATTCSLFQFEFFSCFIMQNI